VPDRRLRFDAAVPHGGYRWWYVDALSDDGRQGLTVILFVGSVFSPYYARARGRGPADPENHVAVNVALYGQRGAWTMTERGGAVLRRNAAALSIGPSSAWWDGTALTISVDEVAVPVPRRVRGTIRLEPEILSDAVFALDAAGRHRWRPTAPVARVEVDFPKPGIRWQGRAYLDGNDGDGPLERDFVSWDWSRAASGEPRILYDAVRADGSRHALALRFGRDGRAEPFDPPPTVPLPRTLWRLDRRTAADPGTAPRIVERLEDGPFYARAVVTSRVAGADMTAVHESLSLARFRQPWVRALLPFRMPRRG
jgi:carotenoid 1,2-hydratase